MYITQTMLANRSTTRQGDTEAVERGKTKMGADKEWINGGMAAV